MVPGAKVIFFRINVWPFKKKKLVTRMSQSLELSSKLLNVVDGKPVLWELCRALWLTIWQGCMLSLASYIAWKPWRVISLLKQMYSVHFECLWVKSSVNEHVFMLKVTEAKSGEKCASVGSFIAFSKETGEIFFVMSSTYLLVYFSLIHSYASHQLPFNEVLYFRMHLMSLL